VLDLSSTDLVVNVPLDPSLRQLVHVGDRVQIQLPEGQTTTGRVRQVGAQTAATVGQATAGIGSPDGSEQGGSDSSAQGNAAPPAVPVTVTLDQPGEARGLDQVPVEVQITDAVRRDVLAVPVEGRLALAHGGYAVSVESRGAPTLIPVTPGIFDGDRVQVSSPRLRPGMRVEVPST
jgi:multidrug efflux pump subunit AcrA (membrane-fusion protein)